jgi:hypothetical protein
MSCHTGSGRQLSEIDGYHFGRSTGKKGHEQRNETCIEECSNDDEAQQVGEGANGLEEEEDRKTEEGKDTQLHNDVRDKM